MDEERRKRLKSMTFGQRLEYFWMYYKGWIAAAVLVIGIVCAGTGMHQGRNTKVALNIVVAGGDARTGEWLREDFTASAGIEKKDGEIRVKAGLPESNENMTTKTALTTLMGAEAVDVLVCTEKIYEDYHSQEGFFSIEEILGEKGELEDAVVLESDNILTKEGHLGYEKVYVAVPVNCQNKEMAARFIRYLKE